MAKSLAFVHSIESFRMVRSEDQRLLDLSLKQPFQKREREVLFSEIRTHKDALSGLIGRVEFIYYIAA